MTTLGGKKKIHPTHETREFVGKVVKVEGSAHKGLEITHPMYYQMEIDKFSVGDNVTVKVTNKKRLRTAAQNSYLHLYFSLISVAHGHAVTADDVKRWAVGKFLSRGITEIYGERVRRVRGTSELTVLEMVEFIGRIEAISGLPAPDPAPFNLPISHEEFNRLKRAEKAKYEAMRPKDPLN